MLKMILDAMGSIVLTNDGNAILREIDVSHPAAKSMIELSRTQDEEVGDGTTSVTVLAGELLSICEEFLHRDIHPTVIVSGMFRALEDAVKEAEAMADEVDPADDVRMTELLKACLGTKFITRHDELMVSIALEAVRTVRVVTDGKQVIDIKNFAKIEKIPSGEITDSKLLRGVMLKKDVTNGRMKRRIENPRIVLFGCPLKHRKAESTTNVEISDDKAWARLL